ncbi:metallophosphoesterase family protein [Faecalicoccus acidiformans]|uniref:metallophosphoesterase family protein n=1 Tax=Faecalicoccus acidiformans TaxID=915173 RepID=UPI003207E2CE
MIYLTSDTHREIDIHKINPDEFKEGLQMNRDDYLIICGDFGCIWDGASGDRFWLNWLETLPWTTLFIDGNHENFDVLKSYPIEEWKGGKVHRIRENIYHLQRGEIFQLQGETFFAFGGGYSHDRMYRTEHKNWWAEEICDQRECQNALKNLERVGWKVDYVLTHDVFASHPFSKRYSVSLDGYPAETVELHSFLDKIEKKLDYQIWFHGHYHVDDLIWTKEQRPVISLFDRVVRLDRIKTDLR